MKRTILPLLLLLIVSTTALIAWVPRQSQSRVFGVSVATVEPGHMREYMGLVEENILPFLAEQGVEVIGVFRNMVGGPSNELTMLLAYRDLAHLQEIAENSQLTAIQQDTFEGMRVLTNTMLVPVPFSPLQ